MKVLTLWQPWASLVGLGVKTIETRSWSTKYRGPLAIHSAARNPEPGDYGPWHVWNESGYVWWLDGRAGDPSSSNYYTMPSGIIATCTLVDVVPIVVDLATVEDRTRIAEAGHYMLRAVGGLGVEVLGLFRSDGMGVHGCNGNAHEHPYAAEDPDRDDRDQLPYGDFTPGRFAWLLSGIAPVDPPVPFKGGQGLSKTWTP